MTQALSPCFFPMENIIQDYAWGSCTSINELLGIENPNNAHQAEIWMLTSWLPVPSLKRFPLINCSLPLNKKRAASITPFRLMTSNLPGLNLLTV